MSKGSIVRAAHKIVSDRWPSVGPTDADCFHLSLAVVEAAAREGRRLVLQAGSFNWRRVPERLDDGVVDTHFAYVWENPSREEAWEYVLSHGWLPEIHVWAGDPEKQQLIDLSTGNVPAACLRMTGEPWLGPPPPDFVWEHVRELPTDGSWDLDREATMFVGELAQAVLNGGFMVLAKPAKSHQQSAVSDQPRGR